MAYELADFDATTDEEFQAIEEIEEASDGN